MLLVLEYIEPLFVFISIVIIAVMTRKRVKKERLTVSDHHSKLSIEFISGWIIRWGGILAAVVVLFSGWLITNNVSYNQEKFMKQKLRMQTVKLVHSFHPEQISRLKFTVEDKNTPFYERIKNQIRNYAFLSGVDGIYTVKKAGNNFFFGPESYMPGDPLYSPPGTKYIHPPSVLGNVFSDYSTIVTDPYHDEYGSFVSCFAPVMDIDGDDVLMVVGIDIPLSEWIYHKNIVKILPLVITLLLFVFLLAGFKYARKKKDKKSLIHFHTLRYWEGVFAMIAGLIISLYIAKISFVESNRYKDAVFSQSASAEAAAFARSLDMVKHSLLGISKLFTASETVTHEEFNEYVERVVDYPFIASAGWIEHYPDEGFFSRFSYPPEKSTVRDGKYPANSDTLRFGAILETLYTGFISATNSYKANGKRLVDLFLVTKDKDGNTNGFASITMDLDALMRSLLHHETIYDNFYEINLKQISSAELDRENGNNDFFNNVTENNGEVSYEFLDFFFGKVFSVYIEAGSGFYKVFASSSFWTPFVIGMLITVLITLFIVVMINRRLILENEIDKYISNLEISEERFKSLFSNMREGVAFHQMIYDGNSAVSYRIMEVNRAFEDLLGLKREWVIGKEAKEAYSEFPSYFDKYIDAVSNRESFVFESFSEIHKKYFEISVTPWGQSGFATIFSDITKRREAENRLKKSKERYRLISENAGDLIWVYDPKVEAFSYVSPSVKKLTGFSYEELVGKNMGFILEEESFSKVKSRLPLRIARYGIGEEMMRVEKTRINVKKKSGGSVPLEVITTLLLNDEKNVTGILGVGRDISDRLAAENALKVNEEKYRLLVENQSDLVVKVDREGYLLYVSPSYCKLFAKSEDELLNKKFMPLVHPEDRASTEEAMKKLNDSPHQVLLEQRAMTKDGWKWLAWSDTAILNERGEISEIIGVGRDVTEQKMAEKALQESREMLERQNEEYASLNEEYLTMNEELTSINEDLSTAIERAEESEKLKTAFLQNMSHEIRTPLNSIIGFSEMLGMDYLTDDDRKEFTTIIVNSSRQLLDLVNDILTISAIETRQEMANVIPVNINDLVSELHGIFRSKAKEKGVLLKLNKSLNNGMAVLLTDELKLRQILINLLGNALKFTDEGFVEYGYELKEDSEFVFYVKDTGVGIPLKMQDRIFDRFMQADNNIKGHFGGTGLGLAICKGHVEMLGGKIWLESTPGVGSVFYFTLPVLRDGDN
ncbi:PAS domain S-box protein [Marinilabilia rubra]|uniref:histidine kinase n=1 Tax=Marinilabilia rubra TaxID=2162893 RepID=A0A2U2B6Q2_9BACT|nr:PAS domain S-box protein [Marinilabilia rubra]PWD98714.1 PAS domain-containing sensor histidine kinase [Marinilabilia rubra]